MLLSDTGHLNRLRITTQPIGARFMYIYSKERRERRGEIGLLMKFRYAQVSRTGHGSCAHFLYNGSGNVARLTTPLLS